MHKKIKIGLVCLAAAALSTVAIAQTFTTFINARVTTQLDLQGTVTANGATGTAGQALTSNGAGDVTWSTVVSTPGGSNTQVQFNNSGVFGGDAGLTYIAGTDTLTVGTLTATAATVGGSNVCRQDGTNCPTGGSVTSITAGTGLSASPSNPITSTGTLTVDQAFTPTWTGFHTFSNANLGIGLVSSAASVPISYTPTGFDAYRLGAGAVSGNDFGLYNLTRSQSYMTFTGGASGGEVLFQRSGAGNLQTWSTGSVGATWSADHISSGHVTLTTTSELVFAAPTLSIQQSYNPDADLGAALGTSALRFSEAHVARLCLGTCANEETISDSGTTVYLAAGATWTDVNIPNVLSVDGSSSARIIINDTGGASSSSARFSDNGTLRGLVGSANANGSCVTGDSEGDVCLRAESGALRFSVNGGTSSAMSISNAGAVVLPAATTVNSQNVCLANGTNCPSSISETSGSESMTMTAGCTTNPSVTGTWRKLGTVVTLKVTGLVAGNCTANGSTQTVGTLSAGIRPTSPQIVTSIWSCNGSVGTALMNIQTNGTILILNPGVGTNVACGTGAFLWSGGNITYSTAL